MSHHWFYLLLGTFLFYQVTASTPDKLCSFDSPRKCDWENVIEWKWRRPHFTGYQLDGPITGPTGYVLQGNLSQKSSYTMTSNHIAATHNTSCFTFDYYIDSDRSNGNCWGLILDKYTDNGNKNTELWSTGGVNADVWATAKINFAPTSEFSFHFIACGGQGYIALTNFRYFPNEMCPTTVCDFELGNFCGWKNSTDSRQSNYVFKIAKAGETPIKVKRDHSSRSATGHIAFLNSSAHLPVNSIAILKGPDMQGLQKQCFSLWFMRSGGSGVRLKLLLYHQKTAKTDLLWQSGQTHRVDEWIQVQQSVDVVDRVNFVLEATKIDTSNTTLSLDDLNLAPFDCPQPISCTFLTSYCSWKEELTDNDLLWTIGIGRVANLSRLDFNPARVSRRPFSNRMYSDFTTLPVGKNSTSSMEMLSEFVDSPKTGAACFAITFAVGNIQLNTDSFQVKQIDVNGYQRLLYNFTSYTDLSKWKTLQFYVANPPSNAPYRFSLRAKSSTPYTYVVISKVEYSTNLAKCDSKQTTTTIRSTLMPTINPAVSLNCDFESRSLCNWNKASAFKVASAQQFRLPYAPFADHTKDTKLGHFAYLNAPDQTDFKSGTLQGVNPLQGRPACFSFWYHFLASGKSTFQLTMDNRTTVVPVFSAYGANLLKWRYATVTIEPNSVAYDRFTFNATVRKGILAIDDIVVKAGPCPTTTSTSKLCDFERDTSCLFTPVFTGSTAVWKVFQASEIKQNLHLVDHSTHTTDGHIYGVDLNQIPKNAVTKKPLKFEIATGELLLRNYKCFRFSYYLANVQQNTSLSYQIEEISLLGHYIKFELKVTGTTAGLWFSHSTNLETYVTSSWKTFRVRMNVETHGGDQKNGVVFIDDVIFDGRECRVKGCDFEDGDMCSMETVQVSSNQITDTQVKLSLLSQTVNSRLTVAYLADYVDTTWHVFTPRQSLDFVQIDHSVGTVFGKYALLTGTAALDRGVLVTPQFAVNDQNYVCISIAIYNPGKSVVAIYQGELDAFGVKLWSLNRKTEGWEVFQIQGRPLLNSSKALYFYIVGTLLDATTYIALDDIINEKYCDNPKNSLPTVASTATTMLPTTRDPMRFFTCKSGRIIPIEKTCNYVKDCERGEDEVACGSCDFTSHSDLCRYDESDNQMKFAFSDQASIGPSTGSHENAVFLVVASTNIGSTSLQSPMIHQSYFPCGFSFNYHYTASHRQTGSLSFMKVYIDFLDLHQKVLIWQSDFEPLPENIWQRVDFVLGRLKRTFRLVFTVQADAIDTLPAYHALDYVRLSNCAPLKAASTCTAFRCSNQVCIDRNNVCDFDDNCGDGSDETGCDMNRMMSFEFGLGRWGQGVNTGWKVVNAETMNDLKDGPTFDHTQSYFKGSYLFAKGPKLPSGNLPRHTTTTIAEIDSPFFAANGTGCQVGFFVFKNSHNSTLVVTLQNVLTGNKQLLYNLGIVTRRYEVFKYQLRLDSKAIYKLIFTAVLNSTADSYNRPFIALDDISFNVNCAMLTSLPTQPTLPNHSPVTTPKPDSCPTVSCLNGNQTKICLKPNQFCDFINDCANGYDEKYCGDCDFDDGTLCHWNNPGDKAWLNWKVIKPAGSAPTQMPRMDANKNINGGYATIFDVKNINSYVPLRSPQLNGPTPATCKLQFSYRTKSGAHLQLHLGLWAHLLSIDKVVPEWKSFQVEIGKQSPGFNINILGTSTTYYQSYRDIAVDNIRLVDCNPYKAVKPPSTASVSCDFENDLCGWTILGLGKRSNWLRTSDSGMEPGNDHSSLKLPKPKQSGTWLSTQAKQDANPETDYLVTTVHLKAGQLYCFSFWIYFMQVERRSFLGLFISNTSEAVASPFTDARYSEVWIANRDEMRNWNEKFVEIAEQKNDFYLAFVAYASATTVVGLDDFMLTNGSCPLATNFCDFEVNTCDWVVKNGWQRSKKSVYADKTTGTLSGHYLKAVSSGTVPAVMEKSMSTVPHADEHQNPFCLRFFYQFHSDGGLSNATTVLTVKLKNVSVGPKVKQLNVTILDAFNENQLNKWTMATFNFYATKKNSLEIDAVVGSASTSVLIDDIKVRQFYCQAEGNCDFENDLCGWTNIHMPSFSSKNIMWLIIRPNSKFISGNLLHFDHTTRSSAGSYLVMPLQMRDYSVAILRSPSIHKQSNTICFSLFYFAKPSNSSATVPAIRLRLLNFSRKSGQHSVEDVINATAVNDWTLFRKEYTDLPNVFAFQLETVYSSMIASDVGVDDIRVDLGQCGNHRQTTTTPLPVTEKIFDCDFEGSCNWNFEKKDWVIVNSNKASNKWAPKMDHTSMTSNGHYLLANPTGSSNSANKLQLTTNKSFLNDKGHCLTVWYYEDGETGFSLQFKAIRSSGTSVIKTVSSALENRQRWTLIKVDLPYDVRYSDQAMTLQIVYSISRNHQLSIFALDDIKVRPGLCQHQFDYVYTFDGGLEDLSLEYLQPVQQGIGKTITPFVDIQPGAPAVDHTTHTAKGSYFLFMNQKSSDAPTVYVDSLAMRNIPGDSTANCIRFAYQVKGNAVLKVTVVSENVLINKAFFQHSGFMWTPAFPKTTWTIAEFNVRVPFVHQLIFYMEKPIDATSYVALDDLSVLRHTCQLPANCDFDNGRFCSYSPYDDGKVTPNQYNFGLFTAPPKDESWPGPKYDKTTGNYGGGYLYLTAYRSTQPFKKLTAKVISGPRVLSSQKSYCLSMWTRLTTNDVTLSVSVLRFGTNWTDTNRTLSLVTLFNQSQSDWTQLSTTLNVSALVGTRELQVLIEGKLAANSKGLIAIDDILLSEGKCQASGNPLICEDGTALTKEQICDFVKNCPSGLDEINCGGTVSVCDFESGICGWQNMSNLASNWLLTTAAQTTNALSPKFDGNANRYGHYLLLSKPKSGPTSDAELVLNYHHPDLYLKNAFKSCVLQFDYFIQTTGEHRIDVRFGSDIASWNDVYSVVHHSTGAWRIATAHIGQVFSHFMIDIAGHLADGQSGAIALDNLQFINCSLPKPLNAKQHCGTGQFLCAKHRFCISNDDICNYVNDCGDGEDELKCEHYPMVRCNFEDSLQKCAIRTAEMESGDVRDDNARWTVMTARFATRESYLPKIDNTRRSPTGRYIALTPNHHSTNATFASTFYSAMFTTNGAGCRMRFFYYINGNPLTITQTHINIGIRFADKSKMEPTLLRRLQLSLYDDLQQRWNMAVVQYQSLNSPFQFVFNGVLGTNASRIAVDDVSYDTNCIISKTAPWSQTTTVATAAVTTSKPQTQPTSKPLITRKQPKGTPVGGIVAAILVPALLVICIAIGYFFYRRRQAAMRGDEHWSLSMRSFKSHSHDK